MNFDLLLQNKRRKTNFRRLAALLFSGLFVIGFVGFVEFFRERRNTVIFDSFRDFVVCSERQLSESEFNRSLCNRTVGDNDDLSILLNAEIDRGRTSILLIGDFRDQTVILYSDTLKSINIHGLPGETTFNGENQYEAFIVSKNIELTLYDIEFWNHSNYAISCGSNSKLDITDIKIHSSKNGIGAFDSCKVKLKTSTISEIEKSGVSAVESSQIDVRNSIISNVSIRGAYSEKLGQVFIQNSVLDNNGTGFICNSSNPELSCTLTNSLVINNRVAVQSSNDLFLPVSTYNSFYENEENGVIAPNDTDNNIFSDPMLISTSVYIPNPNSQLIGTGNPELNNPNSNFSDIGIYGGELACNWIYKPEFCQQ